MNQTNSDANAKSAVGQNKPYASPAWEEEEILEQTALCKGVNAHHIMCSSPITASDGFVGSINPSIAVDSFGD